MKLRSLCVMAAAVVLAACAPSTGPVTPGLPTVPADLPTTLAAFRLPAAASATPPAAASQVAFLPTVTPVPFTPLPPAAIIGQHVVQPGETIFCIGRAYGVLPAAIAQANGLAQTFFVSAGQALQIPAVEWTDIPDGPVCAAQFQSPFPVRPAPTALPANPYPAMQSLQVSLNYSCVSNCGSKNGSYVVRVQVAASGGLAPYGYVPAQIYDVTVPHCTTGQGSETVFSADRQTAQASWVYRDVACP